MSFNGDARLDSNRVNDSRRTGRGTKIAAGGGGIVVLLLAALFGINPDMLTQPGMGGAPPSQQAATSTGGSEIDECRTGADANKRQDCRILATTQSLDSFWLAYLPKYNVKVATPGVEIFSGRGDTACGPATSAVGPLY